MKLSDKGIIEIAEHEGIVPAPYRDSVGVWTFGIGHTAAAGGLDPQEMNGKMPTGDALDKAIGRAIEVFREDAEKYERRVNDAIDVPLAQHEFDALVSFDFNTGGIYRAQLTKAINAGKTDAYRHFMGWLKPPEIKKRRTAEMNLFRTGDYDANGNSVPVWKTNSNGKLIGVDRVMHGDDILRRMGRSSAPDPEIVEEQSGGFIAAIVTLLSRIFGGGK